MGKRKMPKWFLEEKEQRYPRLELVVYSDDGERFRIADIYNCNNENAEVLRNAFVLFHACKSARDELMSLGLVQTFHVNQILFNALNSMKGEQNADNSTA
jgi:hypothetical protein